MRRFIVLVIASVIAWFVAPVGASAASCSTEPRHSYTYDAQVYDAPGNNAVSERGPPAHSCTLTAYDAVSQWSHSAADWVNERMGADPYSLTGIMGQVTFAAVPIGPVGLAGKAATGTRLLRGATPLSRTTKGAKSADDVSRVLSRSDLNPAQLTNFIRYTKKLPAGAEPTTITRGAEGAVQLSTKVPGRVPGSYATYDKVVDASGTTIGYTKTAVAPNGTIVHVKDKFIP